MTARALQTLNLATRLPVLLLIGLVRLYQLTVSPLLGPVCRFYPSCSHYGLGALRTHGAIRGTAMTLWRILRCNPWNPGGVDLVPPARAPAGSDGSAGPDGSARPVGPAITDHTAVTADTDDDVPAQPAAA